MPEQLQPLKAFSEVEHAVYFHSRERTRSKRDITTGLFRNLLLALDVGNFAVASLGGRARPITVVQSIEVTGASPSGVIWEVGSSTQGSGLSFDAGDLKAAAGDGTGDGGVGVSLSGISQGERVQIAVAINPGTKRIGIYVNGHLEAKADGVDPFTSGEYSDNTDGRINGVNGTVTPRLGVSTTLTDVAIVSPVSFYLGQIPRGFQA